MKNANGVSLVEVVVAVTLFSMFIGLIASSYAYISFTQGELKRYSVAASIAKSNLNKYKYQLSITCTSPTQTIDLLTDASTNKQSVPNIGFKNIKQSVTAKFEHSCNSLPTIISKVEYDEPNRTRQVTFAAFGGV